jgi:hypothetical protein
VKKNRGKKIRDTGESRRQKDRPINEIIRQGMEIVKRSE